MAVSTHEEVGMTDKQSQRMGELEQLLATVKLIDKVDDPESRAVLEAQKKEIIERLDNDR